MGRLYIVVASGRLAGRNLRFWEAFEKKWTPHFESATQFGDVRLARDVAKNRVGVVWELVPTPVRGTGEKP